MQKRNLLIVGLLILAIGMVLAKRSLDSGATPDGTTAGPAAASPLPRLVDLGAGKCIPCKAMAPILEDLRQEYAGKFDVVFIDVWEAPDAAKPYNIHLIPTQIFYDAEGKELWRHEGFLAKQDILDAWAKHGMTF